MALNCAIGPFVLDREIGRGGMAGVFSARHRADDTPVAIKVLLQRVAKDPQFSAAFALEVRAAARLDHLCITAIYDHGVVDSSLENGAQLLTGSPWLAMELVEGGSLSELVGQVSWNQLRGIVLDVLDGLAHAHARGIVHRDIKPANILMDAQSGRIKITDFGLVHSIREDMNSSLGVGDRIAGTPAYMAPEQIEAASRDFGPWTDVYAVGVLAWALATITPPYRGQMMQVFAGHLGGVLPTFRTLHRLEGSLAAPRSDVVDEALFGLETVVLDPDETTFLHAPALGATPADEADAADASLIAVQ